MLRAFNESDWMGYAGAEPFDDGSQPTIDEAGGFVVIVDRSGITAQLDLDATNGCYSSRLLIENNQKAATILAELLTGYLRAPEGASALASGRDALARLGFSELEEL